MPLQSHGRVYLAVAFGFVTLFLFLKISHRGSPATALYARPAQRQLNGIGNETLGVSSLQLHITCTSADGVSQFEKIFVINAPWRTDRKDSISLAATYSGIALDWIDGINVSDINKKAYPPGNHKDVTPGGLGSWRAHMDAMRE